jgi:isoamylase
VSPVEAADAEVHDPRDEDIGRSVVVFLNGMGIPDRDPRGQHIEDDSFLLAFNTHHEDTITTLPGLRYGSEWTVAIDTADAPNPQDIDPLPHGGKLTVTAHSFVVLRRTDHNGQPPAE